MNFIIYNKERQVKRNKMPIIQVEVSAEKKKELLRNASRYIHTFIENNPIYLHKALHKNEKSDNIIMCNNFKYLEMLVAIEYNINNTKVKGCKTKITDGRGQNHLFIYDKKDGVFHNKKRTKILCPHVLTISLMFQMGLVDEEKHIELSKSYVERYGGIDGSKGLFEMEVEHSRVITHTGNHHRNHFVSVPTSVYGN